MNTLQQQPTQSSRRSWPGIWSAVWITFLWAVLSGLATAVVPLDAPSSLAVGSLIAYALVLSLARTRSGLPWAELFPVGPIDAATIGLILIAFGGFTVLLGQAVNFSVLVIPIPESIAQEILKLVTENPPVWFVMTVVVAPIGEELLFRGAILRGLTRRYSVRTAVWVSTLAFTLVHLNPWQSVLALPLGLLLAWLYLRTKSLVPCMLAHAVCNLTGGWLLKIFEGFPEPDTDLNVLEIYPVSALVAAAVLATVGFARLNRKLPRNPM